MIKLDGKTLVNVEKGSYMAGCYGNGKGFLIPKNEVKDFFGLTPMTLNQDMKINHIEG